MPKALLAGPSPEAKRYLVDLPIDYVSGSRAKHSSQDFVEHFRVGADAKIRDTQYQLASREAPFRSRKLEPGTTLGEGTSGWPAVEPTVGGGGYGAWGWGGSGSHSY